MLKNIKDARSVRTEKRLKETMLRLLREKPLRRITAVELCRESQVNRATFYDHFQDVYDLVDKLEDEVLFGLRSLMAELERETIASEQVSGSFFQFIYAHNEELSLFLFRENGLRFARKIDGIILPYFEKAVRKNYNVPPEGEKTLRVALRFLATGYYSLYWESLKNGGDGSELSALAAEMSEACLSGLFPPADPA